MTREKAIAILVHERDNDIFCGTDYRKKVHEAQTMAIQALEQTQTQDGDRTVSLNAVKETLCSMCDEWRCNENCSKKREFDKLPSASLEQTRWIPVTEYEPEEYGEFMITWVADEVNKPLIGFAEYEITGEYDHEKNKFKGEWLFEDYVKAYANPKVTAWMPLPEPYREDG